MDLKPKGLFKRVFDFALAEIDRRSRPPERLSSTPASAHDSPHDAPHTEIPRAPKPPSESIRSTHAVDAELPLELTRASSGALVVRWSVNSVDVSTARTLAAADANLAVRLVSFAADAHAQVRRDVLDLPAETLSGYLTLQRPENERLVVSVGLLKGEDFVSIVHAQLD